MSDKDKLINELVLENGRLRAGSERKFKPCRTCVRLKQHDCCVFYECPLLGIVNPDVDGCTKHIGGNYVKKEFFDAED